MAKTTNLGDKYNHRLTLRLNDAQLDFLVKISTVLGCTPSEYIRMSINSGMVSMRNGLDTMISGNSLKGEVGTNENVKTDCNNLI